MEDDLKKIKFGRRHQIFFNLEDDLKTFQIWKMSSKIFKFGKQPQKFQVQKTTPKIVGRRPKKCSNLEDVLKLSIFPNKSSI